MDNKGEGLITQTETSVVTLIFIGLSMSISSLLIVVVNFGVIVVYVQNKKLRIPSNYFIVSLAASDIIIGAVAINLYTVYILKGEWPFSVSICMMWLCADYWCLGISTLTLLGIAFDRYLAVCLPYKHRVLHTKRNVALVIAGIWIVSFLVWIPAIFIYPYVVGAHTIPLNQCYIQFILESPLVTLLTAAITYYLPLMITAILYTCISYRLMKMFNNKRLGDNKKVSVEITIDTQSCSGTLDKSTSINISAEKVLSENDVDIQDITKFPNIRNEKNDNIAPTDEISKSSNIGKNHEFLQVPEIKKLGKLSFTSFTQNISTNDESPEDNSDHNSGLNSNCFCRNKSKDGQIPSRETLKRYQREKRGVKLLLLVILAFAFTWMPYFIATTITSTTRIYIPEQMWRFCYIFGWLNSLVNPVCYAFGNRNFKNGFKKLFSSSRNSK